ncbi:hypothetical protein DFJ77DRAFT_440006 [Powellomyces hirtus]|nr:hypothetical protein DFJ77DRAFT_440006 [Powellomyces hirtus]
MASVRSKKNILGLRKQDGVYLLVNRKGANCYADANAAITHTSFAPEDPHGLIEQFALENIKIVTCTVTNKGYHLAGPYTLDLLRRILRMICLCKRLYRKRARDQKAQSYDASHRRKLLTWIEAHVDFLTSMVDRITLEPTDSLCTVVHSAVGMQLDHTIHWQRKFYLLNASHLVVALCGQRLGCHYIFEAMRNDAVAEMVTQAQKEWASFLVPAGDSKTGDKLAKYMTDIRTRILSAIDHASPSNATNFWGSQPTLSPAFATALCLHNLSRRTECGMTFQADDPDFHLVQPIHQALRGHLAALPASVKHLPFSSAHELLRHLGTSLDKPQFVQLAATNSAFVISFALALVTIDRKPLVAAIVKFLSLPRSPLQKGFPGRSYRLKLPY